MVGKFDSLRDSALHYLCSVDWGNESFGDVSTYGVYIWRISNTQFEVSERNMEFNSVIQGWEESEGTEITEELRNSLIGHFMVSENEQGQVTVKEYTLESELIRHFNMMQEHYNQFDDSTEEQE